jgi:Cu2+-containing amine oxidase
MGVIDPLKPITSSELEESVHILKTEKKLDQNFKFITVRVNPQLKV